MAEWTEEQRAVVQKFREWKDAEELSGRDVAELLDCSRTVASQMLSGSYGGDIDRYVKRMRQVLRRHGRRERAPVEPDYVPTDTARHVLDVLQSTHIERGLALVTGPTGIGKTTAVRHYCEREEAAIYLAAGTACTAGSITKALAEELEVETSGRSTWQARNTVADRLGAGDYLLVVDEVDYCPESTYQCLRQIHDRAQCGIVLVGTPATLESLRNSKSRTIAQVMGRVARAQTLGRCPERDLREIAAQWDLDEETVDALVELSAGQARRMTQILRAAQRGGDIEDLDAAAVREAAGELMEPVSV